VYSRQQGLMKDMPAVLAAVVAGKDSALLSRIFPQVIDSPKMLRNFVQVLRSGVTGRKSLGTRPKKLIQQYLASLTDEQLFNADVGQDPSLKDIIKMVHPKPNSESRSALYGYLLDKKYNPQHLCQLAKQFELFKKEMGSEIPDVPFQMLTQLPLTDSHWKQIAANATWTQTRLNLNTFERHGVFKDAKLTQLLANKLQDAHQVEKAKVFPYQLFTAFKNMNSTIPSSVSIALQQAAEISMENIPTFPGQVYVMVDTSGSMSSPVTGHRGSVTSKMRCIDVAALVAAAIMRKNPNAEIIPFDTQVHSHRLNPWDSVMTNAQKLSNFGGGGTDCSIALRHLNNTQASGDLVIYVSDNESWVDPTRYRSTATMAEWVKFKSRNKNAKLVCIDVTPNGTVQASDGNAILNIGGFSDSVFEVIAKFTELGNHKDLWINTIESVEI
jgi:60 kDa SS-A/Ro ribonucleoprotein